MWKLFLATRTTARMTAFHPAAAGLVAGVSGRKAWIRTFFNVNGIATGTVVEDDGMLSLNLDTGSKAADITTAQNHVRAGDQNTGALLAGSY
jgi:hypothetical protein